MDGAVKAEQFGAVVAYVGDFNGDHFGDWAVGTPRYDIPPAPPLKTVKDAGQVKIISGNDGSVLAHVEGAASKDGFGTAIAGNADVNNDGFMDVVVGAPLADDTDQGIRYWHGASDLRLCGCGLRHVRYGTRHDSQNSLRCSRGTGRCEQRWQSGCGNR